MKDCTAENRIHTCKEKVVDNILLVTKNLSITHLKHCTSHDTILYNCIASLWNGKLANGIRFFHYLVCTLLGYKEIYHLCKTLSNALDMSFFRSSTDELFRENCLCNSVQRDQHRLLP